MRDEVRDLALIALDEEHGDVGDEVVHLCEQLGVVQHGLAEAVERALDRAGGEAVWALGVAHQRRLCLVPQPGRESPRRLVEQELLLERFDARGHGRRRVELVDEIGDREVEALAEGMLRVITHFDQRALDG